ncbi:hypothetical protein GWI33_015598 [Rhynchophorus ferrugineus]|uniref:Uncharacterized protein n=1 Tax=Rhynchophorus ferrugineus TaxID=354439 RepID=A0A834I446_RHYFE|nr:hypothetical protein GWI33_015598 [Rhynchophorus ferrugineus]
MGYHLNGATNQYATERAEELPPIGVPGSEMARDRVNETVTVFIVHWLFSSLKVGENGGKKSGGASGDRLGNGGPLLKIEIDARVSKKSVIGGWVKSTLHEG